MRYFVTLGGREISVEVTALSSGGWSVTVDGQPVPFDMVATGGALSAIVNGRVVDLCLEGGPPEVAFGTLGGAGTARIESEVTFEDGRKGVLKAELKIRDAQVAATVAPLRKAS